MGTNEIFGGWFDRIIMEMEFIMQIVGIQSPDGMFINVYNFSEN